MLRSACNKIDRSCPYHKDSDWDDLQRGNSFVVLSVEQASTHFRLGILLCISPIYVCASTNQLLYNILMPCANWGLPKNDDSSTRGKAADIPAM